MPAIATNKKMLLQKQKKSKKRFFLKAIAMKLIIKLSLMLMTIKIMKMKIRLWMSMKLKINRRNKLSRLFNLYKSHTVMRLKKLMKSSLTMMKTTMNLLPMIMKKRMIKFFNLRKMLL